MQFEKYLDANTAIHRSIVQNMYININFLSGWQNILKQISNKKASLIQLINNAFT